MQCKTRQMADKSSFNEGQTLLFKEHEGINDF